MKLVIISLLRLIIMLRGELIIMVWGLIFVDSVTQILEIIVSPALIIMSSLLS